MQRTAEQEFPCSEGVIAEIVEEFALKNPQLKIGIYPSDANFGMQCKLVLRYRTGGAADPYALDVADMWADLLAACAARGEEAAGRQ